MITPFVGRAFGERRAEFGRASGAAALYLDPAVIERLVRALRRIDGFAELGDYDEVKRELHELAPAARELPQVQLRVGRMLESLARVDEAMALYERMNRSSLSQLGRVRCLVRLDRFDEARALLDEIPFDPSVVKEFVEARNLVR